MYCTLLSQTKTHTYTLTPCNGTWCNWEKYLNKKLKNLFNLRCYMLLDLSIPVVWYLVRLIRAWHVVSPVSRVPANQHRALQQPIKIETLWAVVLDFWAVLRDSPRYVYLVLHYHHWRRAGVARPNYIIVSVRPLISLIGTTVKVSVIIVWKFIT